jgi:hypothetical protein
LPDGLFHLQKLRFGVWCIEKEIYTCVQGSKPSIIAVAASGRRVEKVGQRIVESLEFRV